MKISLSKAIFILAAVLVAIWGVVTIADAISCKDPYTVEYPMTNQSIEWTGAGHSGIWRR